MNEAAFFLNCFCCILIIEVLMADLPSIICDLLLTAETMKSSYLCTRVTFAAAVLLTRSCESYEVRMLSTELEDRRRRN